MAVPLHWRHDDHDGVSNHQDHGCSFNCLFRRRLKKTSKLRVTGLCVGNSPGPVNSPHKGPVTRKFFPFDDVIMRGLVDVWCTGVIAWILKKRVRLDAGHISPFNVYLKHLYDGWNIYMMDSKKSHYWGYDSMFEFVGFHIFVRHSRGYLPCCN